MGTLPNVTLNGFEQIVNDICTLSNSRGISWNPLITPSTRRPWNAYAQANLGLVTQTNLTFARSVISNWRIGPYNKTSGKAVSVGNDISGSPAPFRSLLFPVWQMAPINQNYKAIFLEPHSFVGTRQQIIDLGLASQKGNQPCIHSFWGNISLLDPMFYRSSILFVSQEDSRTFCSWFKMLLLGHPPRCMLLCMASTRT